jgi:hypothetical protein
MKMRLATNVGMGLAAMAPHVAHRAPNAERSEQNSPHYFNFSPDTDFCFINDSAKDLATTG